MQSVRGMKVVLSTLLAACLALLLSAAPGADAVDVTTVFDLYGSTVEPFDNGKQDAVKKAIVQTAGHGVSEGDVKVSVTKTFAGQPSGRRLLQDGRLVQAGVELQTVVQTDAGNAQPVATAIKNSLAQPYDLVNLYKSNGGQADYTFFVSSNSGGGSSGGSPPGNSSGNSSGGNSNSAPTGGSSGSGGKKFPAWAAALVAVLVVALVALVAGYCLYKRWWKRRQGKGTDADFGGGAGYFSGSKSTGKSPLVKLQSSSSNVGGPGDSSMGNPAPKFPSAPPNNATATSSSPLDGFRGFLGTRPQTTPDHLGRTTPSPHAATPSRPAWANPRQEPIQEEPAENTMSGFASTTSIPRGAGVPRGEEYAPYAPSRAGRLMSYLRGGG